MMIFKWPKIFRRRSVAGAKCTLNSAKLYRVLLLGIHQMEDLRKGLAFDSD